jgi:hypothetical protein
MEDDARSNWLDIAKSHAQGIHASLGASILFAVLIGLMLSGQQHQLREDEQKERYTACFLPSPPSYLAPPTGPSRRSAACPSEDFLRQLQLVYEDFPHRPMEEDLVTWNNFAWSVTQDATLVVGLDHINRKAQDRGQPPFVQMPYARSSLRSITTFQLDLRQYVENFKIVEKAAETGTSFADLLAEKLVALVFVYQFQFNPSDTFGEELARSLATPEFERGLKRLERATLLATGHEVTDGGDVLGGSSLPQLVTLHNELRRKDPAGLYLPMQGDDVSKLIKLMRDTSLVTIGAGQKEDVRLKKQIREIREGTTDSAVNIPLLNLPLTLSVFGRVSSLLNVALLLWFYWHIHQMDAALKRYRAYVAHGRSQVEAALWSLPGLGRWWLPFRLAVAFCLSMPILLGTCWRLILWWADQDHVAQPAFTSLAWPAMLFMLSIALAREVQRCKSRALGCVP